ncbi:hypothetical protein FE257_004266 [Aspergillus nanangensis]|uniref:DUF4238 domain-containing protein n=1 Tax=Aspergillus nanangensis TaxID=2582783 RepID=A0AAD4CRJ7_ASPNN|nr:hypothetical protein FE257_004266 [Aspergillus nanangensis]
MSSSQEKNLHFIPRFILRKFKSEKQPPAAPALSLAPRRGQRHKQRTRGRDFLVDKVDLERCILTQRPVSTEFALVNMYRDPGFDDNPYHLEDKLTELESKASKVLHRACDELSRGSTLELGRSEVDILRKFLFLMKYRNAGMFDRYNHDHVDSYDSDDREQMLQYMESKGFSKPRDVWFHNLLQLLNVEMDAKKSWIGTLETRMYPYDAMMFELHLRYSFMAFCTPQSSEEEFLLTQNAYSIFEGPSTITLDPRTVKIEPVVYTEYHNFAPISPKLIIILRSHLLLPDNALQGDWDWLRAAVRFQHLHPGKAGSILQDLPVSNCNISYTRPPSNTNSRFHRDDRFHFTCFQLSPAHVATINNLLLEEAYATSSIVYHSPNSLKRSIENYFSSELVGMKNVLDNPLDKRRLYLAKLEKILCDLGGSARCKFQQFEIPSPRIHMSLHVAVETASQLLQEGPDGSLPYIYLLLRPDADHDAFWNDVHQASLMILLRTKLDRGLSTSTLTDEEKFSVRHERHTFFVTFPIERQWLYLKICQNLNKFDSDDFTIQTKDLVLSGAEDKYAKFIAYFPDKRDYLACLMYLRAMT